MRSALLCGLALIISGAYGATVELTDGRVLEGPVVRQTPQVIWIQLNGAVYEVVRNDIAWFSSEPADHRMLRAPVPEVEEAQNVSYAEEDARAIPKPPDHRVVTAPLPWYSGENHVETHSPVQTQTATPPAPVVVAPVPAPQAVAQTTPPRLRVVAPPPDFPQPKTEAEANELRDAVPKLSDASDDRVAAMDTLRSAGDVGLSALYQYGLYSPIPSVRTRASELLAAQGGKRVLKYLIEAFYSAAYPTIPPYNRQYVETLARDISSLTGQDFTFYAARSARAPELAAAMVDWWEQAWSSVPPQLGEPKIDPTRKDYDELLHAIRALTLTHRDFPGANLPPETGVLPPVPNSPSEQEFLTSFPVVPRQSINSYGPRPDFGQEPAVEKTPDPARDAPGAFREQLYLERLREAR